MCVFHWNWKPLLDYTNLLSSNDYKTNDKIINKHLRTNMSSLEFRLRKIDETRKYLIEEINHNDFMSERYNKTCKCLNYIENLLIVASTLSDSASISAFASLVVIPVSITSSLVGIEFVQSLQELKSINQLKWKTRRSMIK